MVHLLSALFMMSEQSYKPNGSMYMRYKPTAGAVCGRTQSLEWDEKDYSTDMFVTLPPPGTSGTAPTCAQCRVAWDSHQVLLDQLMEKK